MQIPGECDAGYFIGEERFVALKTVFRRERFEVVGLGIADDLEAFVSEVTGEASKHEAWAIDGGFANGAFESARSGEQAQFECAGMVGVEAFDGYEVTLHGKKWENGVVE
jgi:hypothetical protein